MKTLWRRIKLDVKGRYGLVSNSITKKSVPKVALETATFKMDSNYLSTNFNLEKVKVTTNFFDKIFVKNW